MLLLLKFENYLTLFQNRVKNKNRNQNMIGVVLTSGMECRVNHYLFFLFS